MEPKTADSATAATPAKNDLLASIVVFLVALPLCMGVAIASGVPVAQGLITGIVGGIVTGALAGCPLQVSGPAAGLTVIIFDIVQRHGLERLGLIVLLAGLMQVVAGVCGLGQWFRAVSPAVIRGMLAGIGLLILGSQFHVMLDDKPPGNGATNLASIPQALSNAFTTLKLPAWSERPIRTTRLQQVRTWQQELGTLRQKAVPQPAAHGHGHGSPAPAASEPEVDPAPFVADLEKLADRIKQAAIAANDPKDPAPDPEFYTHGMLASMGCLELATSLKEHTREKTVATFKAVGLELDGLLKDYKNRNIAGLLGLATIIVIVVWTEWGPKAFKMFPAALVAVLVISGTAAALRLPVLYVDIPDSLWSTVKLPGWETLQAAPWGALFAPAVLVAIVASAETLLCCSAVDQMHSGPRTKYDRELLAQGIGNTLCGIVGALPMTGVIVRSSANVLAGGKTRLSAMLHGMWLLVFVTGMTSLLRQIPTSCLAAILVYTGYKLIDIRPMRDLRGYGWSEVAIYAITVSVIVFEDLLMGVLVGIGLSALKLVYTFSHLNIELKQAPGERKISLELEGAATFLRLPALAATLERVAPGAELHVDLSNLDYVDHACLDLLMTWANQHRATGGELVIDWESLHGRFRRDHLKRDRNADQA